MRGPTMSSSALSSRFSFLREKTQKKPINAPVAAPLSPSAKKANIDHLKDFYLKRWATQESARTSHGGTGTLGSTFVGRNYASVPRGSGVSSRAPRAPVAPPQETTVDEVEAMCNNCFSILKANDAAAHGMQCLTSSQKCENTNEIFNAKLKKVSQELSTRMTSEAASKIHHVRHLTQLNYHLQTAIKWVPGCSELGALSEHTLRQVGQLTTTARHLAPELFAFSKRVDLGVTQKEKNLRNLVTHQPAGGNYISAEGKNDAIEDGRGIEIKSIVSEMDSDCGTQYSETLVTHDTKGNADVADIQSAAELLRLKDEDEQRRWFYSQCLTIKLGCPEKSRARRVLISDLYTEVKEQKIPIDQWLKWIKFALLSEDERNTVSFQSRPMRLSES
eukprot:GEMP01010960.1.p1 GENE.GEMP01010960.1~~GEMP01010960.1.p1  ORF type:complete len:390 (-),score=66.10 GEMP01010960.1:2072-3241(-)